ncbi:phytochrome sensor protein [Synergistales bacterium]|nr:phytochrome sensor protein [Synergistales bacterium]
MGQLDFGDFKIDRENVSATEKATKKKRVAGAENDIAEFVMFIKSLKMLLNSNRTMLNVAKALEDNTVGKFKKVMGEVAEDVGEGKSLSHAFLNSGFFSDNFCNIFEVGEKSGDLNKTLESYIIYVSKTMGMRKALNSAMTYPTVMISVIITAMICVVCYVIPSFKDLIGNITVGMSDVEFNLATRIFFGAHDTMEPLGDIFPIFIIVGFIVYMFWKGKKQMARMLERRIPKLRQVKNEMDWGQYLLLGSVALEAGMLLSQMLKILGNDNLPSELTKRIDTDNGKRTVYEEILFKINGGEKFSTAFKEFGIPPIISSSLSIAEESGSLHETMRDVAEMYLEGSDYKVKNVTEIINPVITIFIATFVAILVGGLMSIIASVNTLATQM